MKYHAESWNSLSEKVYVLSRMIIENTSKSTQLQKDNPFDLIVAIARGGLSISNALSDFLELPVATVTIQTYQEMKKQRTPSVVLSVSKEITGKRVLLIDDIADSGDTLIFCNEYLRSAGATSVATATVFYKSTSRFCPDWYVKQTDTWVIFPFELHETMQTYISLEQSEPQNAQALWRSLKELCYSEDFLQQIYQDALRSKTNE